MRTLLLMRGLPASGKSSWIHKHNLEAYTISPDVLRLMASAPILMPTPLFSHSSDMQQDSFYMINQANDKRVWKMLFELLELRMARGDFTIIDATHTSLQALRAYEELAQRYRYRIYVLDFSDVDLETIKKRNYERSQITSYKAVPESILTLMSKRLQDSLCRGLPSRYTVVKPESALEVLRIKPIDLNIYTSIHHIGDIHGCIESVVEYLLYTFHLEALTPPYRSKEQALNALRQSGFAKEVCLQLFNPTSYYIFLGDYIDRGVGSGEVVRLLLGIMEEHNIYLLEGNHERWLQRWGKEQIGENEFSIFSVKDLEQAGLKPKDTHRLYGRLRQCAYYTFDNKQVICTHGGLPTLPDNLLFTATRQLIYGSGDYEDMQACAKSFYNSTDSNIYQIFGHRNREKHSLCVYDRSFTLEGGVEFGGSLRACILRKSPLPISLTPQRLTKECLLNALNKNLLGFVQRDFCELYLQNSKDSSLMRQLTARHNARKIYNLVSKLRNSPLIKEKSFGIISSFNFTKDVFYNKKWDTLTCKARGLFIDTNSYSIVARSYDKFFNLYEREESSLESLQSHLSYPIQVYIKENGFLGILSANPYYPTAESDTIHYIKDSSANTEEESPRDIHTIYTTKLFITSKSDALGPYTAIMRTLIAENLAHHAKTIKSSVESLESSLAHYLKEQNLSLVFEVIDPINDPHIISYKTQQVILLDAIYNTPNCTKLSYDNLCELGAIYGFSVKERVKTLASWEEFIEFLHVQGVADPQTPPNQKESLQLIGSGEREEGFIEGFVLEDSEGFMVKIKLPYYQGWKYLRSLLESPKKPLNNLSGLAMEFAQWLECTPNTSGTSLISLRNQFLASRSNASRRI